MEREQKQTICVEQNMRFESQSCASATQQLHSSHSQLEIVDLEIYQPLSMNIWVIWCMQLIENGIISFFIVSYVWSLFIEIAFATISKYTYECVCVFLSVKDDKPDQIDCWQNKRERRNEIFESIVT